MARLLALALALTALTTTALAQDPTAEAPTPADQIAVLADPEAAEEPAEEEEPSRFQAGFSVLGTAEFIGAGNGDEIIDIPSYGGVGVDVHLGAMLTHWTGVGNIRFSVLAGYRGNAEYKWGFEAAGVMNDSFIQRHQAYLALGIRSSELVIGGGATFNTLMGGGEDTFTVHGGNLLAELRAGTRSGFTVSLGMNVDFYPDVVRYDGSKVRAINLFFGLGWKTL
jgi:hypothetical protein